MQKLELTITSVWVCLALSQTSCNNGILTSNSLACAAKSRPSIATGQQVTTDSRKLRTPYSEWSHTIHTAPATDKFQFLVMCLKILQLSYSFNEHVLSVLFFFTMQYIPTPVWNSILEIYELPSSLPYKLSTNALALFSSPNWKEKKGKSSVKVYFSSPTDRSSLENTPTCCNR